MVSVCRQLTRHACTCSCYSQPCAVLLGTVTLNTYTYLCCNAAVFAKKVVWPLYRGQLYSSHLLIAAKLNCLVDDWIIEIPLYMHVTKVPRNLGVHFSQIHHGINFMEFLILMQWWPKLVLYMYSGASLIQTLVIQTLNYPNTQTDTSWYRKHIQSFQCSTVQISSPQSMDASVYVYACCWIT